VTAELANSTVAEALMNDCEIKKGEGLSEIDNESGQFPNT
jgi:hypothetical protein